MLLQSTNPEDEPETWAVYTWEEMSNEMVAAATELPTVTETRKGKAMSDRLWNKIVERGEALRRGNLEMIKKSSTNSRKSKERNGRNT